MDKAFKNHIVLEYSAQLPTYIPETVMKKVKGTKYRIGTVKRENHAYASMEWVIPTALTIYFTRPFFDEFFRLSARNLYTHLKDKLNGKNDDHKIIEWLKEQITNSKSIDYQLISSASAKVDTANTQSKSISIFIPLNDNKQIKILFNNQHNKETRDLAIDKLFSLLYKHFKNFPIDPLTEQITKLRDRTQLVYATFDAKIEGWELHDLHKIAHKSRFNKIKGVIDNCRGLLGKDKTLQAIKLLQETTEFSSFKDNLLNLESRIKRLKNEENFDIISYEKKEIGKNKIIKSIMELLVKIEAEFK